MKSAKDGDYMLTDRQKIILKEIIESYIETNEPVGSKVLTEKPYLDFSSATIRYDMQSLEENGYLEKTHTSSGRIPSEQGYKYYLEHLIIRDQSVEGIFKDIDSLFADKMISKEETIKKIVDYISDINDCYTVVLGSGSDHAKVVKLEIVPLNANEAVLMIVTNSGDVQSQKIKIPDGFNMDDLLRLISLFDNAMYDHSVSEIRSVLGREASKPRIRQIVDFRDDVLNFLVKGFARFQNADSYSSGLSKLFNQPEFQERQIMQNVLNIVDSDLIEEILNDNKDGLKIRIGSDNKKYGLEACSIISVPFFNEELEYGTIAIIGPRRMQYNKVIPLLEYIAKEMPKIFNK